MPRAMCDLEFCQSRNWNSSNPQVRERANLMFSRIRNEIGEIEDGLEIEHISQNKYKYTFSDDFATIYITAFVDENKQDVLCVDEIDWNYKNIDWWNIIENKNKFYDKQINRIVREVIHEMLYNEKRLLN